MAFDLYTDGGCWPNPGPGGWAFILEDNVGRNTLKRSGCDLDTTNNRMELTAVIEGLNDVPDGATVNLHSDSEYVVKGVNYWRHGWKKKGWKGVKNDDLWRQVDALVDVLRVTAFWVRGHSGHSQNEACDRMAWQAYRDGVDEKALRCPTIS